jgi:hypothetical protein
MAVSRRPAKKEDIISIFDLVKSDTLIEDCYEAANMIMIKGRLSDQAVNVQESDDLPEIKKIPILNGRMRV